MASESSWSTSWSPPTTSTTGQTARSSASYWREQMDENRFDALTRFAAAGRTRRQIVHALGVAALGGLFGQVRGVAASCSSGVVCAAQCCPDASDVCLAGRCTSCPSGVICAAQCCAEGERCDAGHCTGLVEPAPCTPSGGACTTEADCCAPTECSIGVCCLDGQHCGTPSGPACAPASDRYGFCCPSGIVDAAGTCCCAGSALDAHGHCASAACQTPSGTTCSAGACCLDKNGACCPSAILDFLGNCCCPYSELTGLGTCAAYCGDNCTC